MQWRAAQRGALCLPLCGQRPSFLTLIEPDRLSQRRVFVPANKRVCLQTHTWTTTRGTVRDYCACLCQDRRCLFCPFALFCFVAPPPLPQLPSRTDWDRRQHVTGWQDASARIRNVCARSGHSAPLGRTAVVKHSAGSTQTDRWTDVTELCHWLPTPAAQLEVTAHCCSKTFGSVELFSFLLPRWTLLPAGLG